MKPATDVLANVGGNFLMVGLGIQGASKGADEVVKNSIGFSFKRRAAELDVDSFKTLARASRRDGMTPDHVPSHASNRADLEAKLGRKLTPEEDRNLYNNGTAILVDTRMHQRVSETYGGRNTSTRIEADRLNPSAATVSNVNAYRADLKARGYTDAQINSAISNLLKRNSSLGR